MSNKKNGIAKEIIAGAVSIVTALIGLAGGMKLGYNKGQVATQIETVEKLNGMQNVDADSVTIQNYYSDENNYDAELENASKEREEYLNENLELRKKIDELDQINAELEERINEWENKFSETSMGVDNSENMENNEAEQQENDIPLLKAHEWKNQGVYEEYNGDGNNGFNMYGETYTHGFTISMAASYNMWGGGEQYAIYNIKSISDSYSIIKLLVGHVDGYDNGDIRLEIYLDKSLDESPDYEYIIQPEMPPQEIPISIIGKTGMTIKVINQGGSENRIGFANPSFE